MVKSRFLLFLGFSALLLFAEERADFLVFKDPSGLNILDKYQEPLSKTGKAVLPPYGLLQIIDTAALLGDQITAAVKFSFAGNIYFVMKDGKGGFTGDKGKENRKLLKGCLLLDDTVEILKDKAVAFSQEDPLSGRREFLSKGEAVVRLFQYRNQYGVMLKGAKPRYGFCGPMPAGAWRKIKKAEIKAIASIAQGEFDRIVERLSSANESYRAIFGYFNKQTGDEKSIPAWAWERSTGEVRCVLKGPRFYPEELKGSTQYIVRDLENIFIGKAVAVTAQDDEILISPRKTE